MTDLQAKIDRILWGKSICDVRDGSGEIRNFTLRSLTIQETNFLEYIYSHELNQVVKDGMLTSEELQELYTIDEVWTEKDDIYLRGLERKESILKDQVKQFQFLKSKKKKAEKDLIKTRDEIAEKVEYKSSLFMLSAENRAEEMKRRFMVMFSTQDIAGNQHWPNEKAFLDDTDLILVYNLAIAYYTNNVFNQAETRQIARSGQWRYRWSAAKNGADLFGPVRDWSEMQNAIVYWSQFYDFVLENMDSPGDNIVNDDDACDAWYDDQIKKTSKKGNDTKNIVGTKKASTNKFHQEQFVMVDPNDRESVEKIQEMNTSSTREQLRKEHGVIKKSKGRISEWRLRKGNLSS